MHQDHQAEGLRRLFSRHRGPRVISFLAIPESPGQSGFPALLAEMLAQHGWRILLVQSRPASPDCHPLFQWDAARPIGAQITPMAGHQVLLAPGCKAGDKAIVEAAAGLFDAVIFGGDYRHDSAVALEPGVPQTLILTIGERQAEAGYALLKGLHEIPSRPEILLVGGGAQRVAQAALNFLKTPFWPTSAREEMWHNRHASEQTSSKALTGSPDIGRYVAKILDRSAGEPKTRNHVVEQFKQQ